MIVCGGERQWHQLHVVQICDSSTLLSEVNLVSRLDMDSNSFSSAIPQTIRNLQIKERCKFEMTVARSWINMHVPDQSL